MMGKSNKLMYRIENYIDENIDDFCNLRDIDLYMSIPGIRNNRYHLK